MNRREPPASDEPKWMGKGTTLKLELNLVLDEPADREAVKELEERLFELAGRGELGPARFFLHTIHSTVRGDLVDAPADEAAP